MNPFWKLFRPFALDSEHCKRFSSSSSLASGFSFRKLTCLLQKSVFPLWRPLASSDFPVAGISEQGTPAGICGYAPGGGLRLILRFGQDVRSCPLAYFGGTYCGWFREIHFAPHRTKKPWFLIPFPVQIPADGLTHGFQVLDFVHSQYSQFPTNSQGSLNSGSPGDPIFWSVNLFYNARGFPAGPCLFLFQSDRLERFCLKFFRCAYLWVERGLPPIFLRNKWASCVKHSVSGSTCQLDVIVATACQG